MAEDKKRMPDFDVFAVSGNGSDALWTKLGGCWGNTGDKGGFTIVMGALPPMTVNSMKGNRGEYRLVLRPPQADKSEVEHKEAA